MQTILTFAFRIFLRLALKAVLRPSVPLGFQRRWTDALGRISNAPAGIRCERVTLGGIETLKLSPPDTGEGSERAALLWAHGGGFVLGSLRTHRGLAGQIAEAAGIDVYLPAYRLAPEHPAPAPADDLFAVWRALLESGYGPGRVAIGGDSAGGTLAITTALSIRDMEAATPAAIVLISPVTDLSFSAESITAKAGIEVVLNRSWLEFGAAAHAGSTPLADSVRFADRAWGAGVEVELQRFPRMWHNFHQQAPFLETASGAITDIGGFLRRRLEV